MLGKCDSRDEQRHCEADAPQGARAAQLSPGVDVGLIGDAAANREPRGDHDADGLADNKSESDREHDSRLAVENACRPGHPCVGKREDRQHQITRPRLHRSEHPVSRRFDAAVDGVQRAKGGLRRPFAHGFASMIVLSIDHRRCLGQEHLQICGRTRWDEDRQDHPRKRGVQPGLVKEEPEDDAQERVRERPVDAHPVERDQHDCRNRSRDQVRCGDRFGVKERDDEDRHDVVDDDGRRQKDAQLDRHARAQKDDDRDGERRIGAYWDTPSMTQIGGAMVAYMTAGRMIPPKAARTGSAPDRKVARWPTVNSRLISSPTTKKNTVRSPWLTQWSKE